MRNESYLAPCADEQNAGPRYEEEEEEEEEESNVDKRPLNHEADAQDPTGVAQIFPRNSFVDKDQCIWSMPLTEELHDLLLQ